MVRMPEGPAACEETQWLGKMKRREAKEGKLDARHKNNVLWGTGSWEMATKLLVGTRAGERKPEAKNGLQVSKHSGTTQRERKLDLEKQQEQQVEPRPKQQQPKTTLGPAPT